MMAKKQAESSSGRPSGLLWTTVEAEYMQVRREGVQCSKLRPSTLERNRTAQSAFREFIGRAYDALHIDQITAELLTEFLTHEAQRVSNGTANQHFDSIAQVTRFAHRKRYISHDPATDVERLYEGDGGDAEPDDRTIRGWPCPTRDEVRLILANSAPTLAATGERAFDGSDQGRPVYRGINRNDYTDLYAALSLTGLRIGEARFLTWDDVDFEAKVLRIRPGLKNGIAWQPKTRSSIRRVPIVPELEVILHRLRATNRRSRWVFESRRGTQLSQNHPTLRFREICDALRFKQHYVVHSLRKFWASTVAEQGMDTRMMIKMFGHTDFQLILSTYYSQNDDARWVAEAGKIDFGLGLPRTG